MEAFLARVVVAAIKLLLVGKVNASDAETRRAILDLIREGTGDIRVKLDEIQRNAVDRVDAMDGKMGNLQEQLTRIPGQIISSVIDALNPFKPR